ncbi:hypothetical protein Pelo_2960 [Pelomyxa schiedti]|nr:hypothetical protein Pelo_2960 [Pelomyxa schiedti]
MGIECHQNIIFGGFLSFEFAYLAFPRLLLAVLISPAVYLMPLGVNDKENTSATPADSTTTQSQIGHKMGIFPAGGPVTERLSRLLQVLAEPVQLPDPATRPTTRAFLHA